MSNNNEIWVKKKKRHTRKWIVPFVIFSIFTFTGIAIWLQYSIGMELSSTLIVSFYGFCTGELWVLSKITREKNKNIKVEEEEENIHG